MVVTDRRRNLFPDLRYIKHEIFKMQLDSENVDFFFYGNDTDLSKCDKLTLIL